MANNLCQICKSYKNETCIAICKLCSDNIETVCKDCSLNSICDSCFGIDEKWNEIETCTNVYFNSEIFSKLEDDQVFTDSDQIVDTGLVLNDRGNGSHDSVETHYDSIESNENDQNEYLLGEMDINEPIMLDTESADYDERLGNNGCDEIMDDIVGKYNGRHNIGISEYTNKKSIFSDTKEFKSDVIEFVDDMEDSNRDVVSNQEIQFRNPFLDSSIEQEEYKHVDIECFDEKKENFSEIEIVNPNTGTPEILSNESEEYVVDKPNYKLLELNESDFYSELKHALEKTEADAARHKTHTEDTHIISIQKVDSRHLEKSGEEIMSITDESIDYNIENVNIEEVQQTNRNMNTHKTLNNLITSKYSPKIQLREINFLENLGSINQLTGEIENVENNIKNHHPIILEKKSYMDSSKIKMEVNEENVTKDVNSLIKFYESLRNKGKK